MEEAAEATVASLAASFLNLFLDGLIFEAEARPLLPLRERFPHKDEIEAVELMEL